MVALLLLSTGLGIWLLRPGQGAEKVEIWSDGELLYILDLRVDQQITVDSDLGSNTITIRDGKIAVTDADCPDHWCMDRGYCSGGAQIVCLPHRLVIRFVESEYLDGVAG